MTISNATLVVYIGEDFTIPETIYSDAAKTIPQDITDWTDVVFVVHAIGSTVALITKTVGAGIVLTTPLEGLMTATVVAADTLNMAANQYAFYFARTATGTATPLTVGTFILLGK